MDIFLIIAGSVCLLAGVAGCILPVLPGPPVAWLGLLLLHFTDRVQFTPAQLILWFSIVIIIQILDYFTPALGARYSGGTAWGNRGCVVGTVAGIFFLPPWGILIGPFVGAVAGELLSGRLFSEALKAGFGAFLGFLAGFLLKLFVCGYFIFIFIKALI